MLKIIEQEVANHKFSTIDEMREYVDRLIYQVYHKKGRDREIIRYASRVRASV